MKRTILLLMLIMTAACAPAASSSSPSGPVVLATTTFLADIAQNVAGDRLHVDSLIPTGVDPHEYQASPSDVAKISKSTVLIVNGLGYEQFLTTLVENAGGQRSTIEASAGLSPRKSSENGVDPHMWLDPKLVLTYVQNIRDGLTQADPTGADTYRANAEKYAVQLKELDGWIVEQVSSIPADKRFIVTNHEALGYFADRYGFQVIGTILPSFSSDASTSAREMAQLIDQIKATGASAIFMGEVENPSLADQVGTEAGVKVVNDLYLESLTDGAPAATYIDMMKHNVTSIVEALR